MISTGAELMHVSSEPGILYFGTPVVLISTTNKDGSYNLAPMSSAFWLGWLPSGSCRNIQDDAEHHADRRVRPQSAVRRQCRRSETSRAHDGVKSGSGGKGAPGLQIHAIAA